MGETISSFVKTADWKAEKHVPAITAPASAKAGEWIAVEVAVGKEIPHPNTTAHHISSLALHFVPDGSQTSILLARYEAAAHGEAATMDEGPAHTAPGLTAKVQLAKSGTLHATAYCNIHGLWTSSAKIEIA